MRARHDVLEDGETATALCEVTESAGTVFYRLTHQADCHPTPRLAHANGAPIVHMTGPLEPGSVLEVSVRVVRRGPGERRGPALPGAGGRRGV